ncbi:HYR-like domain-containing protein [Pseudotamlana agarivorans]|uniref:HYR-like domain-containing protein n=1 Tax=Pseudotamlana agarivorans TaxID=481183 RepID=UPI0008302AE5|nr:gliding motility-associated C-terminal domain-containing protein [Tamlana agarivorans]
MSTQSPSIRTGVNFGWSTTHNTTIEKVTVNSTEYNTFVVPSSYELTTLGPNGNGANNIRKDGNEVVGSSTPRDAWNTAALDAFQDKNLNHYFTSDSNGEDLCGDFAAAASSTATSQRQSLIYSPAIPSNDDGILAITERGGNNCLYVEVYGYPAGSTGGTEQRLGDTFVRTNGNFGSCTMTTAPVSGSDYWASDRCNDNGQGIGIALFYLDDLAPTGSLITRIEFVGATEDHGDGKFFLLQKYAVDQQLIECLDNTYNGDLNVLNNAPANSTYTIVPPTITGGGTFTSNTDGTYTFTPAPGYTGTITFSYELCLPPPNTTVCESGTVSLQYVNLPPEPTHAITCNSTNNFTLEVTSPLGDYAYSIDNGSTFQSSSTFDNLTEGSYSLIVKSTATDCEKQNSSNPIILKDLVLTGTVTDVTCKQDSTGEIDITVSGGQATYTYSWTGPNGFTASTEDLTNLVIGDYEVKVTDSNGCEIIDDFTVSASADTVAPTITCPNDITINTDSGLCTASSVNLGTPVTSDNCMVVSVTNNAVEPFALGSTTVTWTVEDNSGNKTTCTQLVIVEDNTPASGTAPSGTTSVNACAEESAIDSIVTIASDISAIEGAYTDVCGIVSATFKSQTLTGDSCGWSLARVYIISDGNNSNDFDITITHTGRDQTAPILTGTAPSGVTNVDACLADAQTDYPFNATTLAASYSDNCNNVTVNLTNTNQTGNDCSWTFVYTYEVVDDCGNKLENQTITHTGSDQTAPTLTGTAPSGVTNADLCLADAQTNYPFDATAIATSYSDNCNNVTVNLTNTTQTGDGCSWTLVYTYEVVDDCGNKLVNQTITHTGSDQTSPTWIDEPANLTVECDSTTDASGVFANWLASFSGTDTCGTATVTNNSAGLSDLCGVTGTETVTFTLTDDCGNSISKEATFTIEDTTNPTWTNEPTDLTVECDGTTDASGAFANWLASFSGTDTCGTASVSNNSTGLSDLCGTTGTETVTFTLTDDCGNSISKEATFTIEDTTNPTWTNEPTNLTVECDGTTDASGAFANWLWSFSGTDSCGTATVTNNSTGLSDLCGTTVTETVTFTLTDDCGNAITKEATFTIEDHTNPTWTNEPTDLTVECDGTTDASGAFANWLASFSGTDTCGTASVSNNSTGLSDLCGATGSETVTFTLTDDCGNAITKEATFNIEDNTAPIIDNTNKVNIDIVCGTGNTQQQLNDWLNSNAGSTATDNCSNITWTNNYGSDTSIKCIGENGIPVVFTATDDCGNSSTTTATYIIKDDVPPTLTTQAQNVTVQCDGVGNTTQLNDWLNTNGGATATENCSTIVWSNDFIALSDGCGVTGSALVIFTATDACGNTTTTSATFTIEDSTNPTWTNEPADLTVECNGTTDASDAFANWLTSFGGTDTCGTPIVTNNSAGLSDLCGATGAETVTFTLTDDCGNAITKEATFTIEDNTNPTWINEPVDLTVECDGTLDASGTFANWLASFSGTDSCGTATVSNNSTGLSDLCGATGSETVTFTLTDDCGNAITKDATFTIEDNTAPTIDTTNQMNIEIVCGAGNTQQQLSNWLNSNAGATATDNCSNITWSNNYGSDTAIKCIGETGIEVVFTATDDCGNSSTTTATYLIKDDVPPTLTTQAQNVTVQCDGLGNTTLLNDWLNTNGGAIATENCSTIVWSNDFTALSDNCGETGSATITFTATDACGNTTSSSATFTIEDTTNPTWTNEPSDLTVECDGTTDASGAFANWLTSFSGTDTCGTATVTNNSSGLSDLCGATGTETVTFTLADECGNSIAKDATFTIEDTTNPTWTNEPSDLTVECDGTTDASGTFANWLASFSGIDTCGTATITNNSSGLSDLCGTTGSETVIFTLTDDCGNVITKDATFTIEDTTNPTWTNEPTDLTVECDGTTDASGDFANWLTSFSGTDTCGTAIVTNNSVGLSDLCGATGSETVTFTLTDDCGNAITKEATFTIEDNTAPTIDTTNQMDIDIVCGAGNTQQQLNDWLNNNAGATATDNCSNITWSNNYGSDTAIKCIGENGIEVVFTATDDCGNSSTTTASYLIKDDVPPTLTTQAQNIIVQCDGVGNTTQLNDWLNTNGGATATENCSTIVWSNDFTGLSDDCGETGSGTVTFTATDACGNTASTSATFTIEDTSFPTWTNEPSDLTVECDGATDASGAFSNWLASFSGTDTCGTTTVTNNSTGLSDLCGATGTETVTFTLTDDCGNAITKEASFTIEDHTNPTWINEPSDLTVECDGTADASGAFANWLASFSGTDTCGIATVTNNSTGLSDLCGATGTETVTFTLTDDCGNSITKVASFTIEDTTNPTWTNEPADLTVECDGTTDVSGAFANWLASFSGTDTCGIATVTNNSVGLSDLCGATGTEMVTFTLTDDCGNFITKEATFTIEDTTAPIIDSQNLADIEIICGQGDTEKELTDWLNSNAGATATDSCSSITWSNNYGGDNAVKCKLGKGIEVIFTAEDECGNTSNISAYYHIRDITPPTLVTPASDLTVECDGTGNLTALNNWLNANGNAVATEDCSTIIWTNDFTGLSNSCGETGSATVIFTATDGCGNATITSATFTIEDTTAPSLPITPSDITYECLSDVPVVGTLTASDQCSGLITAIGVDVIDDTNPCHVIIKRTWTFTDDCSNTSRTTQTITVTDTTAPVLDLPVNVTAECSDSLSPIIFGTATATDNCDPAPVVTYNDVKTNGSCSGTYTITRTWTATDSCGNTVSADQIISTSDTTAPTFDQSVLPVDVVVECDNVPASEVLTASDNCGNASVSVSDRRINGSCPSDYIIKRTYTATDECGLTNTHIQTITVQDTKAPVFVETLPATTLTVECDAVPSPETLTATDICGSATVTVNDVRTNGYCKYNYSITRTWTAKDECGLTTTHTQIITVQDTKAPLFVESSPTDITVECDAIPFPENLTATDNCGNATVSVSDVKIIDNCANNYVIERTYTAKDECGLTTTHTQIITVQDTTAPTPSTSFEANLDVSCTNIPEIPNVTFTDNCSSNITIDFEETNSFDENVLQDYQIIRTWTVKDECLNEATYTQTLHVTLDEIYTEFVAPDTCFNEGIVDLNSLIPDDLNKTGLWEIIEGESAATLVGHIFDPTNIRMSEDFRPGTDGILYRFRYTTTDNGCMSVNEVVMNLHADCVVLPCGVDNIKISTAITPNGDGYNDTFDIKGIDLCGYTAEVQVFNRWGALVYQSNDYTLGSIETSGVHGNWDGSSPSSSLGSSGRLPSGTYYYIINLKNSGISPLTGSVYIGTN